ncbi:hypothetical protein I601_0327 [Nocardioides dokdonensis FR1436]|uniref:Uncharacterized protein n=1 Tax=Nocardioides dokdonensis FR1436 TaxID=1300347 RepID=A0A1A9GGH0_9ACTN|nr:hypothetical protein [Nocardioides dokdonensis]ANH36780.1 hypothetical protein I601_0327 [Nocardioides dokdonensis FR1436]
MRLLHVTRTLLARCVEDDTASTLLGSVCLLSGTLLSAGLLLQAA